MAAPGAATNTGLQEGPASFPRHTAAGKSYVNNPDFSLGKGTTSALDVQGYAEGFVASGAWLALRHAAGSAVTSLLYAKTVLRLLNISGKSFPQ